jgi:hypothetical protein
MTTDLKRLTLNERGQIMRGSATVAQMIVTNGNNKQMVADRNLFMAAPELLAALKEQVGECFDPLCDMCSRHEELIRKATGAQS